MLFVNSTNILGVYFSSILDFSLDRTVPVAELPKEAPDPTPMEDFENRLREGKAVTLILTWQSDCVEYDRVLRKPVGKHSMREQLSEAIEIELGALVIYAQRYLARELAHWMLRAKGTYVVGGYPLPQGMDVKEGKRSVRYLTTLESHGFYMRISEERQRWDMHMHARMMVRMIPLSAFDLDPEGRKEVQDKLPEPHEATFLVLPDFVLVEKAQTREELARKGKL